MNNTNLNNISTESTIIVDWQEIQNKPSEFCPEYHTHSEYAKRYHQHSLDDLIDVNSLSKEGHTHDERYYTKDEMDSALSSFGTLQEVNWNDILNKPDSFPAMHHTHNDEYYTKDEINATLKKYALKDHKHAIGDIDGGFVVTSPGGIEGGNGGVSEIVLYENYTQFTISSEDFSEDEYGLYYCTICHDFGTKNIATIVKDINSNLLIADIECLDEDNIIVTVMDNQPIVVLVKKIAVK